ncbi:MAG: LysR family transcriptional regulator substrate-binding protein, partial [Eubacteriales bacterium]
EPKSHLHANQLVTALDLVRQNQAVTFASDTSIKALDNGDGMVFYKLDREAAHRKVYISYRKNRYVTLAMQKFIRLAAGQTPPATEP